MIKFKVGDKVKVESGKDKSRDGEIERIFPKIGLALIPGINIYKKHVKGRSGQKGGIYEIPRPLAFAKIALICPKCSKVTRIGFKVVENEKRRICKKCKREIDTKKKAR
ncbi:MAG: 50S ribosomal protein L24 [Microgenomates group bacterium GW2011_GWC1_37_8]|uniref:Large ribosomal subunit protein uL24 n=2 Tax=Candidatus Woeseibacteriota TaxID=1752722 RepID=A0A0G0LDK5_9BACT|nr:MAG: 50S ribosomal protein L24 [Microgenomates group bacterium GW2011_GWC1_37_8]KKQ86010.1 MAG: 50S ribosomal protein L24 [Candidatus Woesebacteria bacterium GW2011_GWB1_38_8]OGM21248.1 MAG: 50S ribosomal protein L24 [Candidatus Woesebacteria bacterium RIFCSPHIGHO2_01_FULL_38_9b]